MSITYRLMSGCLILCLLSSSGLAKSNLNDWHQVRILEVGTEIGVKTKQGEKYNGYLRRATADALEMLVTHRRAPSRTLTLQKDEVQEVRKRGSRVTSGIVGGAIGTGIGLAIGLPLDLNQKSNEDRGLLTAVAVLFGALFGALIGVNNPFKGRKVYVAS